MSEDPKLDHVIGVVRALYGDTSVSLDRTRARVETVRDECLTMLDSIAESEGEADETILSEEG